MEKRAFVLASILIVAGIDAAGAEIHRPWCAQYYGGDGNNGTTCTFTSYDQCMMTARGSGAICVQNPWYRAEGRAADTKAARAPRR
ncbi:MAG: DUF3551 domain-containing protein [Hyphomicrobiales bacterium]|nr:DUF3551 domain-containing protein [Hyphomicrobiales bacterium]